VFLFAGAVAAVAGGLFASLQSYITPDAFTLDLSVLFFIAILIGGRSSILGPLLGTILLTVLPEFAAPLVAWSTFL
jgi:branched-chain amino acid transport system permease protein